LPPISGNLILKIKNRSQIINKTVEIEEYMEFEVKIPGLTKPP